MSCTTQVASLVSAPSECFLYPAATGSRLLYYTGNLARYYRKQKQQNGQEEVEEKEENVEDEDGRTTGLSIGFSSTLIAFCLRLI